MATRRRARCRSPSGCRPTTSRVTRLISARVCCLGVPPFFLLPFSSSSAPIGAQRVVSVQPTEPASCEQRCACFTGLRVLAGCAVPLSAVRETSCHVICGHCQSVTSALAMCILDGGAHNCSSTNSNPRSQCLPAVCAQNAQTCSAVSGRPPRCAAWQTSLTKTSRSRSSLNPSILTAFGANPTGGERPASAASQSASAKRSWADEIYEPAAAAGDRRLLLPGRTRRRPVARRRLAQRIAPQEHT